MTLLPLRLPAEQRRPSRRAKSQSRSTHDIMMMLRTRRAQGRDDMQREEKKSVEGEQSSLAAVTRAVTVVCTEKEMQDKALQLTVGPAQGGHRHGIATMQCDKTEGRRRTCSRKRERTKDSATRRRLGRPSAGALGPSSKISTTRPCWWPCWWPCW